MHFHRFIERGHLKISLESAAIGEDPADTIAVPALNPFQYDETGHPEYPKIFTLGLPGDHQLVLKAHIWPPLSDSKAYKLDGKVAARQCLYFYRRDRLVQAGGWNDGTNDAEPHSSLARVAVNLPADVEDLFALDIKKSGVREPPGFADSLRKATAPDGTGFPEYRRAAQDVYRRAARTDRSTFPLVPWLGVKASLRARISELLAHRTTRTRRIDISWGDLDEGQVFSVDRDSDPPVLTLNRRLRRRILAGQPASGADAQLFKILLFLLLRDDLDAGRLSKQIAAREQTINDILLHAVMSLESDD
jgi:hypothetical protein